MKEGPIIFSGPMVRGILGCRKTKTRRIVNPQPSADVSWEVMTPDDSDDYRVYPGRWAFGGNCGVGWMENPITSRFGEPGDRLWVRETWCNPEDTPAHETVYRADNAGLPAGCFRWRPSIHMPRWASRLTLEVCSIRVERLQEITEEDAIAEGVTKDRLGQYWNGALHPVKGTPRAMFSAQDAFMDIWESIHGPGSWDANPWVWVVEFKVIYP